jgi:hypothetical protein
MPNPIPLAVATAVTLAAMSLVAAPEAEARKYKHRHAGVSIVIGAPVIYGGYRHYRRGYDGYYPSYYYRGFEPACLRWGWVYSRSGKAKWRCIAW